MSSSADPRTAVAGPSARREPTSAHLPGPPDAAADGTPSAEDGPRGRTSVLVGAAAAVVAAAGSWVPALWSDEVATSSAASRDLGDLGRLVGEIDAVHAAYYLLLHVWTSVAGTSPLSLRLPSAVAIGVAAAGVHVLARRLAGPRTALVAAAAFALLPRTTWAGVEARPFALAIAVAVWLTVLLHVAVGPDGGVRDDGRRVRRGALVGYGALLAVGIAVNLYVVLVAVAHGVTLLAQRRTRGIIGAFLLAAGTGAAAAAPMVLVALGQQGQLGTPEPGLLRLARNVVVNQWFLGETPTPTTADGSLADALSPGGAWKVAALLLAAACWLLVATVVVRAARARSAGTGGAGSPDRDPRSGAVRAVVTWALPWLLVPTVLVVAGSAVSPSLYNARYLGVSAPALALLLAVALRGMPTRRAVAVGALLVLLTAPVYASQRTETAKSGSDWLAVLDRLEGRTQEGDGVYFGPRDPFVDGVVTRSLRVVRLGYPEPFEGLVDVTLLETPAEGETLFGTSEPLAEAVDRLDDVDTLWVLRRQADPAGAEAEDRLLEEAGFRVVEEWDGPQTEVLQLSR